MQEKYREQLAAALQKERARFIEQVALLEDNGIDRAMSDSLGELSMYDNHPADQGTELFERSKDIGLQDNARILLTSVEDALRRVHDGTYGICEACGREIPFQRLEAVPWADKCLSCQQTAEEEEDSPRPLEEAALTPPFKRTFLDEADYNGFDGEDAIQDVLKYGSSDSPQDIPGANDYQHLYPNHNEHSGIVERTDAIPAPEAER